jgi:tetratricopeptide (TPR) repeat protein
MMFQLANGPEVPVTIWDQPARVLMKLLDLDDDKPAHRLMLAMFNLCGGKTEGTNTARHYLQTLTESTDYGEKASFYLDAIDEAHAWELLNKGWQAFAAGQWAAVRSHLAELREAYGETDVYAHFAGGLEGHGPDVDTMLAKAEEALGPEETTTAEASEEKPAKAEPLKTFKVLKANAERRARLEMQMAQRHGRLWHTIHVLERMGDIDKAERLMQRITMQGQSPNQDSHPVEHHGRLVHYTRDHTIRRNAYAFMDHAKLLIMCDKQKYVEPMLQKASEIIGEQVMAPAWLVERPDRIRQFAAEYEQNVARLTELESKAATDPDPDTLYQIVRLTDPDDYDAPDAMKHFEAVHRLVETFPEYDRVKNGDLLWNYFRVLRDYHLYEKAIAVDERLMKECPDYRHVKRQDAEWDKAETYVRWGLFLESIGDPRRALECYKTARTLFNKFRLAHKSDRRVIWRSRPPPQSAAPPIVRGRLEAVTGAINRLSKR